MYATTDGASASTGSVRADRERTICGPQADQRSVGRKQRVGVRGLGRHVGPGRVIAKGLPRRGDAEPSRRLGCVPAHRRPDPLVRLPAGQPDLLAVVDERRPGPGQEDRRSRPRGVEVSVQLADDPVLVVVRQERCEAAGRIELRDLSLGCPERAGVSRPQGRDRGARESEVEGQVESIFPDVARRHRGGVPDLAEDERLGFGVLQPAAEVDQPVEGRVGVLQPLTVLDQVACGIDAEAGDAHLLQPELADRAELRRDLGVLDVEIRHPLPEVAVVEPIAVGVPDAASVGASHGRPFVGPDVPIVVLGTRGPGILEPRVFARAVVDDEVDHDGDAALLGGGHEGLEVVGRAVVGLDRPIVGDVIPVIAGRLGDGHQPEAGHAQIVVRGGVAVVEVVEALREPAQIADTVAVRVGETSDEHLVEDAVGPPRDGRLNRGDFETGWRAGDDSLARLDRWLGRRWTGRRRGARTG